MLSQGKIIALFTPVILIVAGLLWVRIAQFESPKDAKTDPAKENALLIPIVADDPILGKKNARITLVAFEDIGCPACKQQSELLDTLLTSYPNEVKIIWKGLSVTQFPYPSGDAHNYAYCAHKQDRFEAFKSYAFANADNLSRPILENIATEIGLNEKKLAECLASPAPSAYQEQTEQIARLLNIQSVPTIFLNNTQIEAPPTIEGWRVLLGL